ncbi:hypothetical protein [Natrinema sp. 74]|uniref:hypothetical protein n=1 Tax=Natrinema sp. 74 TaxID=3384159 RepID=UPI0038D3C650
MEMKCYLRDKGLIERSPDGEKWRTSMDLWCYAISKAGDDEAIGVEASGQQLLLEDTVLSPETTRYLGDQSAGRRSRARQATLDGEAKRLSEVRCEQHGKFKLVDRNKSKRRGDGGREKAARYPRQSRLQTFKDYDLANWDMATPWFRDGSVSVPTGEVY